MKDLAHDQNLDTDHVKKEDLEKIGLNPDEIDEIFKLKQIIDEVETGDVDANKIALDIDEVMEDIRRSAEHSRLDKEVLDGDDSYEKKMHEADILRNAQ